MNEKQMYEVRVLPLVKEVKRKGKTSLLVDNLTSDETKNMSCEPRMLWDFEDKIYFAEMPLTYRGSSVNDKLFYIYNELTEEEKQKYLERTTIINVTIPKVVGIYDKERTKKVKKRTKKEFFITCTKGNTLEIVICRDNKLKVHSNDVGYWSWFTDQCAQEALDFIEQT